MKQRYAGLLFFVTMMLVLMGISTFKPKPPAALLLESSAYAATPPPVIRTPWTTNAVPDGNTGATATNAMLVGNTSISYLTNTWPYGPTGVVNMAISAPFDLNYASVVPCRIAGLTNKSSSHASTKRLSLYNVGTTNWNLTLAPGISDASGLSSITVSNNTHIVMLLSYTPQGPATNTVTYWYPGIGGGGGGGGGGSPVAAGTNGITAVTNAGVITISFSGTSINFYGINSFGTNATQGMLTIDGNGNLSVYGTNTAVLTFYDSNTNPIAGWDGVMWYGDAGLLTDIPAASVTNSAGPLPLNVIPSLWDSFSAPMGSWFTNNLALPASFNQPTNMGDAWMFSSGTSNEIRFRCNLPGSWDTNVIYAQLRAESSGTNNSTATNVVLGVSAVAVGDGDNESTVTFGTEILVTNHISTAAYISRACTTAAITVGNNPAPEKALIFKIRRLSPGPGGDTMTNTFYLTDAQIYYKKNPGSVTGITPSP